MRRRRPEDPASPPLDWVFVPEDGFSRFAPKNLACYGERIYRDTVVV